MAFTHNNAPSYMDNGGDEKNKPLNTDDMPILPNAEISYRGICSDHIRSGNDFIENGIKQIMTKTFVIERTIKHFLLYVQYIFDCKCNNKFSFTPCNAYITK